MSNWNKSHFKPGYGLEGGGAYACRNCKRRTRDVDGNGSVELCPECYQGCCYENGGNDASDPVEKAENFRISDEWFAKAKAKGGVIADRNATV